MEAMIFQHFYWPVIREAVQKEVTNCDVWKQKNGQQKNGELPDKLDEGTPWNKLCVYLTGPYKILRKGNDPLILKDFTIIEPVTGWFVVTQYRDKKVIMLANLVETTWLVRYTWPVEITYDQGGEFLGNKLKDILIKN